MNRKVVFFIVLSLYIISFSFAEPGLFSWIITDEGLWANDARWMVLWHSLPEDGFAQSLFGAPLFYLMEYYLFLVFGVSLKVFHLFLSLWAVAILFVIMFLLKYDEWWGIVWTVMLLLIVNLGLIDVIPIFLLILSFYFSFKKRMYLLSSLLLSLSILVKLTTLPYALPFFLFILYLSFKDKDYKEMILMSLFFGGPLLLDLLFIKSCSYYFEATKVFLFYPMRLPVWAIIYRVVFNHFVANPLVFLLFPSISFYIITQFKNLEKEDILMILLIVSGIIFMVSIKHVVTRRMLYLFFPLFVLGEKGIKKMQGKWIEILYILPFTVFIIGSANILRKEKYWFAFSMPKTVFYGVYFIIVLVFILIMWKNRWQKWGLVVSAFVIIIWNMFHISYDRIEITRELKDMKGYIFFLDRDLFVGHTFTMESRLKPMIIYKNHNYDRWVVTNRRMLHKECVLPYDYIGALSDLPDFHLPDWERIYVKNISDMTKNSHYFSIHRRK